MLWQSFRKIVLADIEICYIADSTCSLQCHSDSREIDLSPDFDFTVKLSILWRAVVNDGF